MTNSPTITHLRDVFCAGAPTTDPTCRRCHPSGDTLLVRGRCRCLMGVEIGEGLRRYQRGVSGGESVPSGE